MPYGIDPKLLENWNKPRIPIRGERPSDRIDRNELEIMATWTVDQQVERSIQIIKSHQPQHRPYYGCFSGGKDSTVIKALSRMAGANVIWHYNVTTIDPPEVTRYIYQCHKDVVWLKPEMSFFRAMLTHGVPTRKRRWCCSIYKERDTPKDVILVLGLRASESPRRRLQTSDFTYNTNTRRYVITPIRSWTDEQVWGFIKKYNIPYCSLYDEGFLRVGCVGCPMTEPMNRIAGFERWPGYRKMWRRAFYNLWAENLRKKHVLGKDWTMFDRFNSPEELWLWYCTSDNYGSDLDDCYTDDVDMFS